MASALLRADVMTDFTAWIAQRRWFAAKNFPIDGVEALSATLINDDQGEILEHVIVRISAGGRSDDYQLILGSSSSDEGISGDHIISRRADRLIYDALGDQRSLLRLQSEFVGSAVRDVLRFHAAQEFQESATARLISSEQSNSSVIYGDLAIAKFYRRILPGLNPDLEIGQALDVEGSPHTPRIMGWLEGVVDDSATTFAVVHQFFPTAVDGFEHALSSVRDLIASPEIPADQAGGDFSAEAHRLGTAIAEVHQSLVDAFGSEVLTTSEAGNVAASMERKLDEALTYVPALSNYSDGLRMIFAGFTASPIPLQRIHGDLHLGQVLRDITGWKVLDFEGEPGVELAERRRLAPALRDVAGMLRSFDYAARQPLIGHPAPDALLERTNSWAELNRDAFLAGYLSVLPIDLDALQPLLRALEAEKAVYETVYEHRFRPDWIGVPLAGIARLVEGR